MRRNRALDIIVQCNILGSKPPIAGGCKAKINE